MVTVDDIRQLPKEEKIRIMEMIWSDLTADQDDLASPMWHEAELKQTAQRVESGEEAPLDWNAAKAQLLSERK